MGDADKPVAIKIVIVTMFDPPPEAENWPSEVTRWIERVPLPERLPFPLGERDLRLNRDKGVLAVVTGVGNTKAAASIMALGLDPRFDLAHAYWLVAGIAGANPSASRSGRRRGAIGWSMATLPMTSTRVKCRRIGRPADCRLASRRPFSNRLPP